MLSPLKSLMCRHDFFWSERSGCDRCRRCGARRDHAGEASTTAETDPFAIPPVHGEQSVGSGFQPTLVEWSRPVPEQAAASTPESVFERPRDPLAQAVPAPTLVAASDPRDVLLARLDALIAGGTLSRAQTLELVQSVIEDAQSSEPVLVGMVAADYYARLHAAAR